MKEVFVFGSINADLVTSVSRMPTAGETIKGNDFIVNQGGKGANQAAACKKLGCERVRFIGAVGDDMFGEVILNSLKTYGVDCEAVAVKNGEQSGVCTILLDESRKDNFLILSSGANDTVTGGEVKEYLRLFARVGDIFITQLEMNLTAVGESLAAAKEIGGVDAVDPRKVRLPRSGCVPGQPVRPGPRVFFLHVPTPYQKSDRSREMPPEGAAADSHSLMRMVMAISTRHPGK